MNLRWRRIGFGLLVLSLTNTLPADCDCDGGTVEYLFDCDPNISGNDSCEPCPEFPCTDSEGNPSDYLYDCDQSLEGNDSCEPCNSTVTFGSVAGADSIGLVDGVSVYAAPSTANGTVTIRLTVSPANANVASLGITWSGGTAGSSDLERIVPTSTGSPSGTVVTATYLSQTVFNGRIYVFPGRPPVAAPLELVITPERLDSLLDDQDVYGLTNLPMFMLTPNLLFICYYEASEWNFLLTSYRSTVNYGAASRGKTDVTADPANLSPFPPGLGMPTLDGSSPLRQTERRIQAKYDIYPDWTGRASYSRYYAEHLVVQHELFHITDMKEYFRPELESVARTTAPVTISNLDRNAALSSFVQTEFRTQRLLPAYTEARDLFLPESENRAYSDGLDEHNALANQIY